MKISIHEILYEQIPLSTDYWLVESGIIYIKTVVNIMQICKENGSIYYTHMQIIVKQYASTCIINLHY